MKKAECPIGRWGKKESDLTKPLPHTSGRKEVSKRFAGSMTRRELARARPRDHSASQPVPPGRVVRNHECHVLGIDERTILWIWQGGGGGGEQTDKRYLTFRSRRGGDSCFVLGGFEGGTSALPWLGGIGQGRYCRGDAILLFLDHKEGIVAMGSLAAASYHV